MATFGKKSLEKLATCHEDLQKIMNEVIKEYNFTILYGYRTSEEQYKLYKQGRMLVDGKWKKVGRTVTDKDGHTNKSKHNSLPSTAIDIAPYPVDWDNYKAFTELAKIVKQSAHSLGITIKWGGDWKSRVDMPHFELI